MPPPHASPEVQQAFRYCEAMAGRHYENFPVASLFLPREKRPFIAAVYAFARTADDFADEGDATPSERLHRLDAWEAKLDRCFAGFADEPVFIALAETNARIGLPKQLFKDLLTAFRMDVTKKRFSMFQDLLFYCRHSANPVGRLVLLLFGDGNDRHFTLSDNLCTALQLANFWQDISVDWMRGRLYIPLEDLERFGYTEADLGAKRTDERFRRVLQAELERTKELFAGGKPLVHEVVPELRFELRLTWLGGMSIVKKVERLGVEVLRRRPSLSAANILGILLRAMTRRGL